MKSTKLQAKLQIFSGKPELIKLFVEKGADANAKYLENWAPLHRATYLGLDKIASALIENKANVNIQNVEGISALHVASAQGKLYCTGLPTEVTQHFFQQIFLIKIKAISFVNWFRPFIFNSGHDKVVEALIKGNADVKLLSNAKWTALHQAAETGQAKIVEILLKAGVEVDAREEDDWTPLMLAARGRFL